MERKFRRSYVAGDTPAAQTLREIAGQIATRDYLASFTFLGVPNALLVSENATGTVVTIDFTPIGIKRTFQGATENAVVDQIRDYFLSEGADAILSLRAKPPRTSRSDHRTTF